MSQLKSNFRRRAITIGASVSALIVLTATPAFAAVGLPYKYTVDYINGNGGLDTPKFYTNSTGKICWTANFRIERLKDSGQNPDRSYKIALWRNDTFGDTKIGTEYYESSASTTTYAAGGKKCYVGLGSNQDYHLHIDKSDLDTGRLEGYGTISYT